MIYCFCLRFMTIEHLAGSAWNEEINAKHVELTTEYLSASIYTVGANYVY